MASYFPAANVQAPKLSSEVSMKKVVTFLLTQRPEAALAFYRDTLGITFVRDDGFALVFDMNGTMLRIGKAPQFTPAQHTVLGWESEEIAADVAVLAAKGVAFERYPNMGQDELGICTFPSGDKVAWFKDPDGNVLSLSQHAKS
jgi:catechol 2,3-dioxygenase-like lactoylglutathione lyase family enzyme